MDKFISAQKRPVEQGQKYILLDFLTQGKKVTVPMAARLLLIGSLPRRILDLKELGFPINARYIEYLRQDKVKTRVREYFMDPQFIEKREEFLKQLVDRFNRGHVSMPDHPSSPK